MLVAPSAYAITTQAWWLAAAFFSLAVISDFFDGYLARRLDQTSALGGLFDHATDAIYVTAGCWALGQLDLINPYLCMLIPVAFIQYTLDSHALKGRALRTSTIGKSNGVAYFVMVGTAIGAQALGFSLLIPPLTWLAWLLVATTLLSMLDRGLALLRPA